MKCQNFEKNPQFFSTISQLLGRYIHFTGRQSGYIYLLATCPPFKTEMMLKFRYLQGYLFC